MTDILLIASFILLLVCLMILLFCPQVMEKPILLIVICILVFAPLIFACSMLVKNTNHHKQTDREKLEKYIKDKKEHKHKTYSL